MTNETLAQVMGLNIELQVWEQVCDGLGIPRDWKTSRANNAARAAYHARMLELPLNGGQSAYHERCFQYYSRAALGLEVGP